MNRRERKLNRSIKILAFLTSSWIYPLGLDATNILAYRFTYICSRTLLKSFIY